MKPVLYLITTDFPFGRGEDTFILPELPYLTEKFNVTIVSNSLDSEQTTVLDSKIKVIHYTRKASLLQKLWDSICYFFHGTSWLEILDIIKHREKIAGRLFESILFFEEARRFKRFMEKERIIDAAQPSIVYCYWYTYYCLTMIEYSREHPNVKVVTRAHRYDLYDEGSPFGRQPFKKYMSEWIHNIIFIAEHGRQYYISRYGEEKRSGQYQLFRLGVKGGETQLQRKEGSGEFLLVSCSLVIPRKRVELIADALSLISDFDIRWVHFGDGEELEKLFQVAESKLNRKKNIIYQFEGYRKSEEIMQFYKKNYVDVFITTTASEGCPVSVQEAMANGIPIIGTAVAEIPYMINGNGILLSENPEDQEIAKAIRDIHHESTDEIERMRQRSYELWEANFNLDVNADSFVKFLESCNK